MGFTTFVFFVGVLVGWNSGMCVTLVVWNRFAPRADAQKDT